MSRANKALAVLVVASLGLWGCAQGPANAPGSAERIRALETKLAKLEDDFRAAATARDQLRKKLTSAEEARDQAANELQAAAKERDELRQQLGARTGERDALQAQFEQFRKGIRSLLGQADTAIGASVAQPVTSAAEVPAPGKS